MRHLGPRALAVGWAVLAAAVTGVAPAGAATTSVERFHGVTATAAWYGGTDFTELVVSRDPSGSTLFIHQSNQVVDPGTGDTLEYTDTVASVATGFTFSIDSRLSSASLSAGSLPATTCRWNGALEFRGCGPDTIFIIRATWTPSGDVVRTRSTERVTVGATTSVTRMSGWERPALAEGQVGWFGYSGDGTLGRSVSGSVTITR